MPPIQFTTMASPIGTLTVAANEKAIIALRFATLRGKPASADTDWAEDRTAPLIREAVAQLSAYFAAKLRSFDLPLQPEGTEFQKLVWTQLGRIPFGEAISYGELARRVGNANASRAVGMANGRNPIAIVIPCHRVIGANGSLTGFGGGVEVKQQLLELEGGSGFQPAFDFEDRKTQRQTIVQAAGM